MCVCVCVCVCVFWFCFVYYAHKLLVFSPPTKIAPKAVSILVAPEVNIFNKGAKLLRVSLSTQLF